MPWYAAGTINVAASGTTATGAGTAFLGNVRIGDGIAIQGSSSLHEVTGVTSNTQLTFAPPYTGPSGGGKAYRVAPVLGYDKDLSDAFNALRLQFGDQLSSLSPWATASTGGEAMDEMGFGAAGKSIAEADDATGARSVLWPNAVEVSAALSELGFGATGKDLAEAATPDAARSAIGIQDWAASATPAEALDELGFGATGKDLAEASTPADARADLELGDAAIADVVGTMASGAIIERGSNANGEYVRFADGTQICTKPAHRITFIDVYNLGATWTYPAAFAAIPCVVSSLDTGTVANYGAFSSMTLNKNTAMTTTSVSLRSLRDDNDPSYASNSRADVSVAAIGRWK